MKSALRRASTQPDGGGTSSTQNELRTIKRTFSTAAAVESTAPRRPSLATISSSLRRSRASKKTQPATAIDNPKPNRLGQLFFELPNELHAHILAFVDAQDIISLRLTCRTTLAILNDCAPSILVNHLPQHIPPVVLPHILHLYPPPIPNLSLAHHLHLLRLHTIVTQTTTLLTSFLQMKIYMLPPTRQHNRITALTTERTTLLTTHLYPALWTINHYLTSHRALLLHTHPAHTPSPPITSSRFYPCLPCHAHLTSLVTNYSTTSLLPTYQTMRLLLIHLKQSSRAPSYAGTIERVVRRWSRREAGEEELAAVVLLGGLEILRKITVLKGTYNSRLEVVRGFLETVEVAVEEGKMREWERERREREQREGIGATAGGVGIGTGKMVVGRKGGIERVEMGSPTAVKRGSAAAPAATTDEIGRQDGTREPLRNPAVAGDDGKEKEKGKGKGKQPAALAVPDTTSSSVITAHAFPTHLLTDAVLDQIPLLEDIFLPELRRRIEKERLLDAAFPDPEEREEELETPYHWVRRVICGEEEDAGTGDGGAGEGVAREGRAGWRAEDAARAREMEMGMGAAVEGVAQIGLGQQQQQQQQAGPRPQGQTGRGQGMLFSSMSRHMLVSVGRDD